MAKAQWLNEFEPYPGAREVGSQHITGNMMHIIWQMYAVAASPLEVVGFYQLTLSGEKRSIDGKKELSVCDPASCPLPILSPLQAEERCLIVVSQCT